MLTKLLNGLSLLDNNKQKLSLTNIALWLCLIKIAMATNVSFAELTALLLALANYSYKRHITNSTEQLEANNSKEVQLAQAVSNSELSANVESLANKLNAQEKVFNEAKDMINASRLSGRG